MIAGSQTIAGSQAIAEVCFHMIADDRRTFCDLRSSAIIWKPALIYFKKTALLHEKTALLHEKIDEHKVLTL